MRIAAVIPALDAAATVGEVVRATRAILPTVIVVDDGSRDRTADEARRAGAEVHVFPRNRGKGHAIGAGFGLLLPRGVDGIVTLDADGQHLAEEIPRLLALAPGADLVLGTRDHLFGDMSPLRRLSNQLSSRAISWAAGQTLADVQTGFRFYSPRLIARLGTPHGRFEAESVIVIRAVHAGLNVRTTSVRLGRPDGRTTSHYRPVMDTMRITAAVTRVWLGSLA